MVSAGASDEVVGAVDDDPTCRQITVPVSSHAAMNGSHQPGVQRGQAESLGQLGERDGLEAACRVAADLLGGELRVEQPRHLARDDAAGMGAGPLLEVPVVRRADDGEREVGVAHPELVALPREAGE